MRKCKECETQLYGRSDKRFCSDACRSNYHNRENKGAIDMMRSVHSHLKRNWKILKNLEEQGQREVMRESLLNLGFNFTYITDVQVVKNGVNYRFCYDLGYYTRNEHLVSLVNKKHKCPSRHQVSFSLSG